MAFERLREALVSNLSFNCDHDHDDGDIGDDDDDGIAGGRFGFELCGHYYALEISAFAFLEFCAVAV